MSNMEALEQLESKMNSIFDQNFGDFQRKAQTYLNRFKQSLNSPSSSLVLEIKKLENEITYKYDQDLDTAIINFRDAIQKMRGQV